MRAVDRLIDEAMHMHSLGANVVPILFGKRPMGKWSLLQSRRQTVDEVQRYHWGKASGLAIVNGVNDFRCIDIDNCTDHKIAFNIADRLGLKHTGVVKTGSGHGWHIWFRSKDRIPMVNGRGVAVGKSATGIFDHLEVRWEGCLTIIPPSLHESGREYVWANNEPCDPPAYVEPGLLQEVLRSTAVFDLQYTVAVQQKEGPSKICRRSGGEIYDMLDYARMHFGGDLVEETCNEVRVRGNGGLLINTERQEWYCHRDGIGGGPVALVGYRMFGTGYNHLDRTQKKAIRREIEMLTLTQHRAFLPTEIPSQATSPTFATSDTGNSKRFVIQHGSNVRYDRSRGEWLVWTGSHWMRGAWCEVMELGKTTVRCIYEEAVMCNNEPQRKALAGWALQSESEYRIKAMLNLAKTPPAIAVDTRQLDADPYLLNVENGTLNLKDCSFRPHSRNDLLTLVAPVTYDKHADAPFWKKMMDLVFCGDAEMIAFVQRCVGYSLSGIVSEEKLFFCYGAGANGKTRFLEGLSAMLGPYAQRMPAEALMMRQQNGGATPDLARLKGARFVVTTELSGGRQFDEARVKDLTGGDTVVARNLYQGYFEFSPTHKLWIAGNHKPKISGTDYGIWRRQCVIPFTHTIPEADRLPATEVKQKLLEERSGMLNWAIEGYKAYCERGLDPPAAVSDEVEKYRQEMDTVGRFLKEMCVEKGGSSVRCVDMYKAYERYCAENGESVVGQRDFNRRVKDRGYESKQGGQNYYRWQGIVLMTGEEEVK